MGDKMRYHRIIPMVSFFTTIWLSSKNCKRMTSGNRSKGWQGDHRRFIARQVPAPVEGVQCIVVAPVIYFDSRETGRSIILQNDFRGNQCFATVCLRRIDCQYGSIIDRFRVTRVYLEYNREKHGRKVFVIAKYNARHLLAR